MILGTGSNAAFLERADRVHHWEGERHGEKNVIIDIEWGAFGDKGTWKTFFLFTGIKVIPAFALFHASHHK
jgi:hexokinase